VSTGAGTDRPFGRIGARPRRPLGRDVWLCSSGQLISQIGRSFTLFVLPLGALVGAAAIRETGGVAAVCAASGILAAGIAVAFAFSSLRHGDRYRAAATTSEVAAAADIADPRPA